MAAAAAPPGSSVPKRSNSSEGVAIGKYRRLESIGKGSFAVVYKAIHPDDASLLAIKTVQHAQLKGKLKQNLFSEIEILRNITHPHIVALIDILESTNHIHLIMEFCQLGDLATFVKKRDKLATHPITSDMLRSYPNPPGAGFNEVIVRHFAQQLASALEFLRNKNLVHRDLKPQNLLLNPPRSWIINEKPENRPYEVSETSLIPAAGLESLPFLKIADFGFARHLPTTTMAETLCGSPLYMAPEILRYEKYDAKADLWSVGTVLYELMVGRPPFRAANHVDLLRKIERTADKIKFPDELDMSEDMKTVIKGLLRRMPTERMSWETFFQTGIIVNDIPGLVGADRVKRRSSDKSQAVKDAQGELLADDRRPGAPRRASSQRSNEHAVTDRQSPSTPPLRHAIPRRPTYDSSQQPSQQQQRPLLPSNNTAPSAVQGVRNDRNAAPSAMERRRSQNAGSPGTSAPREMADRDRVLQRNQERSAKEARERAAQDVAFERDYVLVEKRAVEVNAFADELAASPQIQPGARGSPGSQPGPMLRRATTQATSSNRGTQPGGTRLNSIASHQRTPSYERRYGPNRTSAQSALAAALNMVNLRFYGGPLAPGKGSSPPQGYGPFPAFAATPPGPLLLGDSPKPVHMDEDHRILSTMEDSATRSDVVYGFAEVKYKQLVPSTPSNDHGLGIRRPGGDETAGADDDDLTVDAIVGISEEALVLYIKALAILTNTINLAGGWWSHKSRGEALTGPSSLSPDPVSVSPRTTPSSDVTSTRSAGFAAVGSRINSVVQWARNRFNECLEKSEYVSRRLLDAQRRLPAQQNAISARATGSNETRRGVAGRASDAGDDVSLSTGVTAEKLMYDRALEMSKSAAVNELVGEDLPGCEVSYLTAVRLLEAVLERDHDDSAGDSRRAAADRTRRDKENRDLGDALDGIEEGDRKTVLKLIESMKIRLATLRRKMSAHSAAPRRASLTPSSGSGAAAATAPVATAVGPAGASPR